MDKTIHYNAPADGQEFVWNYEMNLLQNHYSLHYLAKIYGIAVLIVAVVCLFIYIGLGERTEEFLLALGWIAWITAGVGVICFLVWLLVAKVQKGKCLEYAIDSQKVWRILTPDQIKKDRALGTMNSIVGFLGSGAAATSASRVGTQLEKGSYRVCTFDKLYKVKLKPKYDLIQLKDPDKTMHIYVGKNDYEHVRQLITAHAPQAICTESARM